jgi:hypothetical protein
MRRFTLRGDDRGSLPVVLFIITIGITTSAAMTPIVIRQFTATRNVEVRDTALNAAQAGMDVMMARVRAAADPTADADSNGLLENLPPCTLTGNAGVTAAGDALPYDVTLVYKDSDGNTLADCPPTTVPSTAVLTSVGYSPTVGTWTGFPVNNPGDCAKAKANSPKPLVFTCRQLTATYVFTTTNTTIPGGQIKIASSSASYDMCLDATTNLPTKTVTAPQMRKCTSTSTQRFGYTAELYLKLIYSESSSSPYGSCLDALPSHATGNAVKFDACPPPVTDPVLEKPVARFQWSLDGSSRFHTTNSSQGIEGTCLGVASPTSQVNSGVVSKTCGGGTNEFIWRSDTGVGAGMAGDSTNQLVNYEQFSRCLDVTSKSTSSSYMIAWFCKQAPRGAIDIDWNQLWYHPVPATGAESATGNVIVKNGGDYCMDSPGVDNGYITVKACGTAALKATNTFQWTVFHNTGSYATSYVITDYMGLCLAPTPQGLADASLYHSDKTSKIKVMVCDGSELQKWNAPANLKQPTPLTNLTEN